MRLLLSCAVLNVLQAIFNVEFSYHRRLHCTELFVSLLKNA